MNNDYIITLEDMPGWDNYKITDVPETTTSLAKSGTFTTDKLTATFSHDALTLNIPTQGYGEIALYDIHGNVVARLASGLVNAGAIRYDLSGKSQGLYFLKAKVGKYSLTKAIQVK